MSLLEVAKEKLVAARQRRVATGDAVNYFDPNDSDRIISLDREIGTLEKMIVDVKKQMEDEEPINILDLGAIELEDHLMDQVEKYNSLAETFHRLAAKERTGSGKSRLLGRAQSAEAIAEKFKDRVRQLVEKEKFENEKIDKQYVRLKDAVEVLEVVEEEELVLV
ncbi:MAG: hypothetical protein JW816_02380 [Candidatus Buchananbacteria bacterium]|nr:hypothetical protein [Candidatus Buchananbacteria bacterium]